MRQVNHAESFSHVALAQHNDLALELQVRIDVSVALDKANTADTGSAGTRTGTGVPLPLLKVNCATSSAPVMAVKAVTVTVPAVAINGAAMANVAPQVSVIPTSTSAVPVEPSVSAAPLEAPVSDPDAVGNTVAESVANAAPTYTSTAKPLVSDPRRPADLQEVVDAIYSLDRTKYAYLFANPLVDIEATASAFFNYYDFNGWRVGQEPMRNWFWALSRAIAPGYTVGGKRKGWAITYCSDSSFGC